MVGGRPLVEALRQGTAGERRSYRLAVWLGFAAYAGGCALLALSGYLIARAAERPPILSLLVAIVAVRAAALVRATARYGERLAAHDGALRTLARLRLTYFRRLLELVPAGLIGEGGADPLVPGRAELLTRFVADIDNLQDLYVRAVAPPLVAVLVGAAVAVAGAALLPSAGLLLGGAFALGAVALPASAWWVNRAASRREAPARGQLARRLLEAHEGAYELRLAGRGRERTALLVALDRRLERIARRDGLAAALAGSLAVLAGGLTLAGVIGLGAVGVHQGRLDPVYLAALALLAVAAFEALAPLAEAGRRLAAGGESARRIWEVAGAPPRRRPARTAVLPDGVPSLAVEGVRFRYCTDQPWVLDGVTFALGRGELVVLAGPSGAGKTTVAQLMVRFLDPVEGRVSLGGVDLRELAPEQVRGAVALVEQDSHLFDTTLRDNLALARPGATEEELWWALAEVGLNRWLERQPAGLDLWVGSRGEALSGGQRRRVAVARGLLSEAPFLIVDEPTAHLDAANATAVWRALRSAARRGKGVVAIGHGIAGRLPCDRVLRLEGGRLRELGGQLALGR